MSSRPPPRKRQRPSQSNSHGAGNADRAGNEPSVPPHMLILERKDIRRLIYLAQRPPHLRDKSHLNVSRRAFSSRAGFYVHRNFLWPCMAGRTFRPVPLSLRPQPRYADDIFDLADIENQSDIDSDFVDDAREPPPPKKLAASTSLTGVCTGASGCPRSSSDVDAFATPPRIKDPDTVPLKLTELDSDLVALLHLPVYTRYAEDFTLDPDTLPGEPMSPMPPLTQQHGRRRPGAMPQAVGGASSQSSSRSARGDAAPDHTRQQSGGVAHGPAFKDGLRLPMPMVEVRHPRPPARLPYGSAHFEPLAYEVTRAARMRLGQRRSLFDSDFVDLAATDTAEHVVSAARALFATMAQPHVNALADAERPVRFSWQDVLAAAVRAGCFENRVLDEVLMKMERLNEEVALQLFLQSEKRSF